MLFLQVNQIIFLFLKSYCAHLERKNVATVCSLNQGNDYAFA